jgi:uncharacterized protein
LITYLKRFKPTKRIILILVIAALLYVVVSVGFYIFQEKFIFQPKELSLDYSFQFSQPFKEFLIEVQEGVKLNAVFFTPPYESKGLILYFHGNAGNLQRWGNYAIDFTQLGYEVLMIDYRGYGKSSGIPNEAAFYNDSKTVLQWCKENIKFSRLIIYGRSLGSAVATNLAATNTPDMLILETPFDEIKGVIYPPIRPMLGLFPQRNFFSNKDNIPKIHCRKVIFHGTNDWIVPLSSALKLKPLLSEGDKFYVINDAGHKNLRDFQDYHAKLAEVLK